MTPTPTPTPPPVPPFRALVPMAQVASVERSVAFYAQLGFVMSSSFTTPGADVMNWAWLESGKADLMVTRDHPALAGAPRPTVLFYLYCDDVARTRAALVARGVDCGPLIERFYAPKGEFEVRDPDGYAILVTHT